MQKSRYLFPLTVIGILFFVFGFVTWLNSILIPYFKITLDLSNAQSTLVTFAFFISYFVMAMPSYWVLDRIGFRHGIAGGLLVMMLGALMFIPAVWIHTYWTFLAGLFVMGTGLTLLQTAVNPYVTILGPIEGAARRISFMGIANKSAGILSQRILGGIFLLNADAIVEKLKFMDPVERTDELHAMAERMINPYLVMAGCLLFLTFLVRLARLPEVKNEEGADETGGGKKSVWQYPNLVLGVVALFFSVGVEIIAGEYIISYGVNIGIPMSTARFFTEYALYAMVLGYICGTLLIPRIIKQQHALLIFSSLGIVLAVLAIISTGNSSIVFVALMGFANAILWPAIWPLALKGIGRHTKKGSAMLIMAVSGGALIPILFGKMLDAPNPANAFLVAIACYLVTGMYSAWGHRISSWKGINAQLAKPKAAL